LPHPEGRIRRRNGIGSLISFQRGIKDFKRPFLASWAFHRSRGKDEVNGALALMADHLCLSWKAGQPDLIETTERFFILNDIIFLPLVTEGAIDECSETVNGSRRCINEIFVSYFSIFLFVVRPWTAGFDEVVAITA
jgi:hypothetical protein